jgi:hypothetical protein
MGIEPTSEAWEVPEFTVRVISRTVLCGGGDQRWSSLPRLNERSGRCIRPVALHGSSDVLFRRAGHKIQLGIKGVGETQTPTDGDYCELLKITAPMDH